MNINFTTQAKVKQDKLTTLYRHLNVTDNLDLISLNRFNYTKNTKKSTAILEFCHPDKWASLTKQLEKFLVLKKN